MRNRRGPSPRIQRAGGRFGRPDKVVFRFQDLEITPDALVMHFFDETTVFPLSEIKSYRLNWYLHEPIFAKKWWFLVLTVQLTNGDEESGDVTSVKFNYLSDSSERRQHIAAKIACALDAALLRARTRASARKELSLTTPSKQGSAIQAKGQAK